MGRPPLPLGTPGKIRITVSGSGFRARALYRDYDGKCRPVERTRATKAGAEAALKIAFRDRSNTTAGIELAPDTRVAVLAERWLDDLDGLSPTTLSAYRQRLDQQILPSLGELRLRELSPGVIDRFLKAVTTRNGPSTAKMTKSVLSGMCGLAARHDAIDRNPVRDAGPIKMPTKKAPTALSAEDARLLIKRLASDKIALARDVPDLVRFMLATGVRIGEAAAVSWDAVDMARGTVAITRTVVRVRHEGLLVKETKTDAGQRTLELPTWAVDMLASRPGSRNGPVFPAPKGGWRDPSNTQGDLRDAFTAAGFRWVTSHVLRKTVATIMDQAGLSSRAAADQLGHVNPSMTADVYMGRRVAATGAAAALAGLGSPSAKRNDAEIR